MQETQGIIDILTRIYGEITPLESAHGLIFGNGDFRPRIDYFHDAVRALVAERQGKSSNGRLTVEMLAYDVATLRYIQSMPLASIKSDSALSEKGGVMARDAALPSARKADKSVKLALSELYQQYAVLFSALFKASADRDYLDKVEDIDAMVEQLYAVEQAKGNDAALREAMHHVDDPATRDALIRMHTASKQDKLQGMLQALKLMQQKLDKDKKNIENAHLQYAASQLAIYEEGREMVKKMAAKGMNLAGKFVENAMHQTQREMGR